MHNGRNRLPAAQPAPAPIAMDPGSSRLELLYLLELARKWTERAARRIDFLCQLRPMDPRARQPLDELVRRALAFEESAAALMVALEDRPRRVNGARRL